MFDVVWVLRDVVSCDDGPAHDILRLREWLKLTTGNYMDLNEGFGHVIVQPSEQLCDQCNIQKERYKHTPLELSRLNLDSGESSRFNLDVTV